MLDDEAKEVQRRLGNFRDYDYQRAEVRIPSKFVVFVTEGGLWFSSGRRNNKRKRNVCVAFLNVL
jgi:hypothetical protein